MCFELPALHAFLAISERSRRPKQTQYRHQHEAAQQSPHDTAAILHWK